MDMLSGDLMVDILRQLPPHSLAGSRRVCKAWRAAVDDHRLLPHASQLPLSLDGVIFETKDPRPPMLFSRRSTAARRVEISFEYLDDSPGEKEWYWPMFDYCNGLVLLYNHVVNPATRQWARLPTPPPRSCMVTDCIRCEHSQNRYLAYDPTVSPHYQVFLIPQIPTGHISKHTYDDESTEWPPSTYIVHAFSSETRCWKDRSLGRQGVAVGTVADIQVASRSLDFSYYSAYWQGAIYVPCGFGFILRINLSDDYYQAIKLPNGKKGIPRLGKSKKGVYCALLHQPRTCEIWFLDESGGHMEWTLRNEIDLPSIYTNYLSVRSDDGPWFLQSTRYKEWLSVNDININLVEDKEADFEWDSNDENIVDAADLPRDSDQGCPYFECLGFRPYKEIVLLHWGNATIAYHFDTPSLPV